MQVFLVVNVGIDLLVSAKNIASRSGHHLLFQKGLGARHVGGDEAFQSQYRQQPIFLKSIQQHWVGVEYRLQAHVRGD